MELWTQEKAGDWSRWAGPVQALASLIEGRAKLVLFVGDGCDSDSDAMAAALHVARALSPADPLLVAATPHPSAAWAARVREAGAQRLWLLRAGSDRAPSGDDLPAPICPALHASAAGGVTLSVCGRHADRMVLAEAHLVRWCLGGNRQCPHWVPDDAA